MKRNLMTAIGRNKYRIKFWDCADPRLPRSERGTCGAKTRKSTPCQAPPVWDKKNDKARNGRCKLHGGFSTGPKTEAGRKAIIASNKKRRNQLLKK